MRFQGEFRFLSNFWPAMVELDGMIFPSVEHAYVAAKSLDRDFRNEIILVSPGEAKKLGRKIKVRNDWENVKLSIMENLLRQKFQHHELRQLLLNTGSLELVEGNNWGDRFWGVCDGVGENNLGKLLMKIRQESK